MPRGCGQCQRGLPDPVSDPHEHVIALAEWRAALQGSFDPILAEPAPYLAREAGREDLVAEEEAAIDAGRLRAAGRGWSSSGAEAAAGTGRLAPGCLVANASP